MTYNRKRHALTRYFHSEVFSFVAREKKEQIQHRKQPEIKANEPNIDSSSSSHGIIINGK